MKKILEILNEKLWVEGEEHQIIGKIEAAKEIHEDYMKFMKFVKTNCETIGDVWYVINNEFDNVIFTTKSEEKLYNYWLTNYREK